MLNKKIIGLLLVLIAMSTTIVAVSATDDNKAGTVKFNGSGKLAGHIYVNDINNGSVKIMDHQTYAGHNDFTAKIPNECKYHTISITQHVSGTPADCQVLLYMYSGGDITIDFSLIGNLCKAKASHLSVTYKGKTVEANNHNGYCACWEE